MNSVVLSMGSNMGERLTNLSAAIIRLTEIPCTVINASSVYQTAAWGNTNQAFFYNQVIEVLTRLDAFSLMAKLLSIEENMGRKRKVKWEPRVIDIDILFFNEECIRSEKLTIPHAHLHERRFVLEPLNEILPIKNHPVFHKNISLLLAELKDGGMTEKLKIMTNE